jgi:hypothetical protein
VRFRRRSECRGRAEAQRPLGAVVGRFEVSVGDEDEEMSADLPDDDLDLASDFVGRVQLHEAIEPPVQVGLSCAKGLYRLVLTKQLEYISANG